MTSTHTKKIVACLTLLTLSFASTAQAGNAFNKFQAQPASPQTESAQSSTYVTVTKFSADVVSTKRQVKRVVQNVPVKQAPRVAYVSDHGTTNMSQGFNKMVPQETSGVSAMRILVD